MKRIININLASRVIPIEDSAYELLRAYLDSLKRHFSREEGGDEIVSDIESRIAELFQDKLKKDIQCITDDDVNAMIATMGRPEQLEEETATTPEDKISEEAEFTAPYAPKRLMRDENDKVLGGVCAGFAAYYKVDPVLLRVIFVVICFFYGIGILVYIILWIILPSSKSLTNPVRKRLYRDTDHKVIGGVCSGLSSYFNIDPVITRIIFLLPLIGVVFFSIFHNHWPFSFFFPFSVGSLPTFILIYLILWISVPKAITLTEKMEMRGERVDLQSISNARKSGPDDKKKEEAAGPLTNESSNINTMNTPAYPPPKRHSGFGELIILLMKIVAFFILGIIVIALCGALIGVVGGLMGAATISSVAFPFKNFILSTPLQHFLAWPAVFLTLGIPVVAIIWLFIKLITGFRTRRRYVGLSLFLLWLGGIICAVWLIISVVQDFRMNFRETYDQTITQPSNNKLIIQQADQNISIGGGWSIFGDHIKVADDTVIINNLRLRIDKSPDANYQFSIIKASNGPTVHQARLYAESLPFQLSQQDSLIYVSPGISIPAGQPYRNQRIIMRVNVPIGKKVFFGDHINVNDWNGDWDNDWNKYNNNTTYIMTADGLKKLDEVNNEDNNNEADSSSGKKIYHYKSKQNNTPVEDTKDNNSADDNIKTAMDIDGFTYIFNSLFNLLKN